ncbi:MAG TPA: thioesterase family protein [Acidimicrobiales bacterium]
MPGPFEQACQLEALGGGVYEGVLGRTWWGSVSENGGYVLALALAAYERELDDPDKQALRVTLDYHRPVIDGEIRIEVDIPRHGRTTAGGTVRIWSNGKLACLGIASSARHRPGGEFAARAMPEVESIGAEEPPLDKNSEFPLYANVRRWSRLAEASGPHGARVGGWVQQVVPEVIDHRWLALLVDLWWPAAYKVWGENVVTQTVDMGYHGRATLPMESLPPGTPLFVVHTARTSVNGFVDEDCEIWSPDGQLLGQGRQIFIVHAARRF